MSLKCTGFETLQVLASGALLVLSILGITGTDSSPAVRFMPTSHDFGRVTPIESLRFVYFMKNQSTGRIVDVSIQPDCGCTTIKKPPSVLEARDRFPIEVTFNPRNMRGRIVRNIAVRWRVEGSAEVHSETLQLHAFVQPLYTALPQQLSFLKGRHCEAMVKLTPSQANPPEVKAVGCSTRTLTARLHTNQEDSNSVLLVVEYSPDILPRFDQVSATVWVCLGDPRSSRIEIPVRFTAED